MPLSFPATKFDPRQILILLVLLEILLVILYLADGWIPEPNFISKSWFNLSGQETIPATFSAIQLLVVGLLFFVVALNVFRSRKFPPAIFCILGALFVFLAIDEGFGIHETIQFKYRRGKILQEISWMIPRINWFIPSVNKHYGVSLSIYLCIGTLLFLVLLRPLIRLRRAFPTPAFYMGLGFILFLAGAAGMEMVEYIFFWGGAAERYFGELAGIFEYLQTAV